MILERGEALSYPFLHRACYRPLILMAEYSTAPTRAAIGQSDPKIAVE